MKLFRFVPRTGTANLDEFTYETGPLTVEIYEFGNVETLKAFFNNPDAEVAPSYIINPDEDMPECEPGDHIVVRVGGKDYLTHITEHGTHRFIETPDHFLVRQLRDYGGTYDMNGMAHRYFRKDFTQRDYAEMNMGVGYSICGFCDLSNFDDMQFENPLWREPQPDQHVVFANMSYSLSNFPRKISHPTAVKYFMEQCGMTEQEAKKHIIDQTGDDSYIVFADT